MQELAIYSVPSLWIECGKRKGERTRQRYGRICLLERKATKPVMDGNKLQRMLLVTRRRTSTATRSPSLKPVTPSPISVTIALNSCPKVSGTFSPVIGCGEVGHRFGPPMYSWRSFDQSAVF
jgi:hypothetical protein